MKRDALHILRCPFPLPCPPKQLAVGLGSITCRANMGSSSLAVLHLVGIIASFGLVGLAQAMALISRDRRRRANPVEDQDYRREAEHLEQEHYQHDSVVRRL